MPNNLLWRGIRYLKLGFDDIQMEKGAVLEEQHNALIRKQHLASIRQMESARWRPEDETKIKERPCQAEDGYEELGQNKLNQGRSLYCRLSEKWSIQL